MTWCTDSTNDVVERLPPPSSSPKAKGKDHHTGVAINVTADSSKLENWTIRSCPSCGHQIKCLEQQAKRINELPGLPAGVRFDPTDQELLQHLEAKLKPEYHHRLHPLIDEFIPTINGENGICYTHPEKLPGVSKDGLVRHFFHRPSKAYTTGTRKRRKVHTDEEGCETRWHKTGKTRPVTVHGKATVKGYKKILVLYTNYGKQKKPEKTSWVMHQYHLGLDEEEREGELVVSKVFYQTQPRQCGGGGGSSSGGGSIISLKMKGIGSGTGAGRMGSAVGTHHHHHHNMMGVDHHQNDVVGHPPPVTSTLISFEPRSHGSGGGDHGSGSGGGGRSSPPAALFPFCCP